MSDPSNIPYDFLLNYGVAGFILLYLMIVGTRAIVWFGNNAILPIVKNVCDAAKEMIEAMAVIKKDLQLQASAIAEMSENIKYLREKMHG